MIRIVLGWVAAVIAGVVLGAVALSYFDQQGWLAAAGGEASLSIGERAAWFGRTLYGLVFINGTGLGFGLYPVLVAIALFIGLIVAGIVVRLSGGSLRFWWYAGAGAVALVTIFIALKLALGMMVVPGARTMAGLAAQGAVGFIAGAVFAWATRKRA
ncbi:MAG: hypothetical protein QM698_16145 [Micropepsaceae bacterium]